MAWGLKEAGFSPSAINATPIFWSLKEQARTVLEQAGIPVAGVCLPLIRRLKQEQPGELGAIAHALAECG